MLEKLEEGFEFVIGSRFKGNIMPGAMPWKNRYLGTPLLTVFLNTLYHTRVSDANSGLRAFTREAFEVMKLHSAGMEFASEMIIKASMNHLKLT